MVYFIQLLTLVVVYIFLKTDAEFILRYVTFKLKQDDEQKKVNIYMKLLYFNSFDNSIIIHLFTHSAIYFSTFFILCTE